VKKPALLTGGATVCALALIVAGAATARPQANVIRVAAPMDAAQEVPQPRGSVDNARGTFGATLTRSGAGADMRWNMVFSGLTGPAVAAHIHNGRPGAAGPVVVPLCGPCVNPENGTANVNAASLAAIQAGTAYVNIHTAMNAAGEIRGQIDTTANINTRLTPRREIPKPKGNVRRARGLFRGTVTKSGSVTELRWRLTFSRLTGRAIGAHIHLGAPGSTGRVVVALCGPCRSGVSRTARLRPSIVEALEDGLAYVNVHTRRNTRGEIRGNIPQVPLSIP
jgi:hypothetical protein